MSSRIVKNMTIGSDTLCFYLILLLQMWKTIIYIVYFTDIISKKVLV